MREEAKLTLVIILSLITSSCLCIKTKNVLTEKILDETPPETVGGEIKIPTHLLLIRNLAIISLGTALVIAALTRKRITR